MRTSFIIVFLVCSLTGCQRESGEDTYKRIKGGEVFKWDYLYVVPDYRKALEAAKNNERSYLNEPYYIAWRLERVEPDRNTYTPLASRFDSLIDLIRKWPVRVSQGTVFFDTCDGYIVKENITRSRWVTFDDYLTNRYAEFRLDTLIIAWARYHSDYLGGDLSLPDYYEANISETDTSSSIHLSLADTARPRYHAPSLLNSIHIFAFKSSLPFQLVAKHYGIKWEWTDIDHEDKDWTTHINDAEVEGFHHLDTLVHGISESVTFDASDDGSPVSRSESDSSISLTKISLGQGEGIYFYSRQRRISSYGRGQIVYDIKRSFAPTRAR